MQALGGEPSGDTQFPKIDPPNLDLRPEPGHEPKDSFKVKEGQDQEVHHTLPPKSGHSLFKASGCHHPVLKAARLGSDKD